MPIVKPVEVWVPIIGEIRNKANPPRPDLPGGTNFGSNEAFHTDLTDGDGLQSHATSMVNIIVEEADMPKISAHLAAKYGSDVSKTFADGPKRDVLFVKMLRACKRPHPRKPGVEIVDFDSKADAFFDAELPASGLPPNAQKWLLGQAVARGLSATAAEAIRVRHGLPERSALGR